MLSINIKTSPDLSEEDRCDIPGVTAAVFLWYLESLVFLLVLGILVVLVSLVLQEGVHL